MSYDLSGLGLSLKPPKKLRKAFKAVKRAVTLKRVLVAGAVVGGAALVPGALPAIARVGTGAARIAAGGVRGAARLAVRGVRGGGRLVARGARGVARPFTPKLKRSPKLASMVNRGAERRAARNAALTRRLAATAALPLVGRFSRITSGPRGEPILTASASGSPELSPAPPAAQTQAAIETQTAARTGSSPIAIEPTESGQAVRATSDAVAGEAPAAVTGAGFKLNPVVLVGAAALLLLLAGRKKAARA